MKRTLRGLAAVGAAAAAFSMWSSAQAATTIPYDLDISFKSGAQFTGVVDLSSNLSKIVSVLGTLTDYTAAKGLVGSGSDIINKVDYSGNFFGLNGTILTDASGKNGIELAFYDSKTKGPELLVEGIAFPKRKLLPLVDPEVSSSLTRVASAVPEPSTWALLLSGVALLGTVLRFGRGRRSAIGLA